MRTPYVLAAFFAIALTLGAFPADACHGRFSTVNLFTPQITIDIFNSCYVEGADCEGDVYLVYTLESPPILALYLESNGIAGLQRGGPPLVQGGHDDCWSPDPDARWL